jgi:hypothetical protein
MASSNQRPSAQGTNLGPTRQGDPFALNSFDGADWATPALNHREWGHVADVNVSQRSYRVITQAGRDIRALRLLSSPSDNDVLPIGTTVRIDWSMGHPLIDGVLPPQCLTPNLGEESEVNPTGIYDVGANDPATNSADLGTSGRDTDSPSDAMPGDFIRRSGDGATIGALLGKTALVYGGPLAQLMCFGREAKVELITGLLRIITWMGESKVINENGRTSFMWKGGANQLTETGPDAEQYTIHLDVGARGNLVNFKITTVDQQDLLKIHVSSTGRIEILGMSGIETIFLNKQSKDHSFQYEGNITRHVIGNVTDEIDGKYTLKSDSDLTHELFNNLIYRVGNDWSLNVNRNADLSVGAGRSERIVDKDSKVVGGDEETNIKGDSEDTITGHKELTADSYIQLKSNNDKVKLSATNSGITLDAGSSNVDVTAQQLAVGGSSDSAVLYNNLQSLLQSFFQTAATHTHMVTTVGGPTTQTGNSLPSIDMASAASSAIGQLSQLQSQKIKMGS